MVSRKQCDGGFATGMRVALGHWWRGSGRGAVVVVTTSLAVATGLMGLAQWGLLEGLEQKAYDQMMRLRAEGHGLPPDDRLLIVTVTEEDLDTLQEFPLTDGTVARAIAALQRHDPVAIGIDMFRAVPNEPGRAELQAAIAAENVVVITQLSNASGAPGIPPPLGVQPSQVSFNDVVVDPDGKIRRALLLGEQVNPAGNVTLFSFSLQLALRYLATAGIVPEASPVNPTHMQLGATTLLPLTPSAGGYAIADTRGHQIMLDYRDRLTPGRTVTLRQVLGQEVDPAWITGKVVLMGVTAQSFKDLFYTPFTAGSRSDTHQMPGVVVHAQMVSQLLDLALGDRPLMWTSQPWQEWALCLGWALLGGTLAWVWRHPVALVVSEAGLLASSMAIGYGLFLANGWVPLVAPALAVLGSSSIVLAYQAQQSLRQR
ncbi:MAG TPA: CHASE2 domain-containing protein, partial [Candidatus Obscuribacterales bacterium]